MLRRTALHAVVLQRVNHGPCIPEIDYPYGENLQLTVETVPSQGTGRKYSESLTTTSTPSAICSLRCAPAGRRRRPTPRGRACRCRYASVSSATGEIIAAPRLTFATAGVPADTRATYLKAINASLDACMPLKFTGGLGGALAGRPIAIRYVDNREPEQHSGKAVRRENDCVKRARPARLWPHCGCGPLK